MSKLFQVFVVFKMFMNAVIEFNIVTSLQLTLFIEELENRHGFLLQQVNTLLVIYELNMAPLNTLPFIFFLFQPKHMMVEMLLQLLISIVDAQLFKRVHLEHLEPINVQQSYSLGHDFLTNAFLDSLINFTDQPVEQTSVNGLGDGVSVVVSLGNLLRHFDWL